MTITMPKAVPVWLGMSVLLLAGCGPENNFDAMTSPDAKWTVIPTNVGGKVKLSVQDAKGKGIDEIQTEVPDSKMWAGGWMTEKVFVLGSQTIGTLAWSVGDDGKFTSTPPTFEMLGAREFFFSQKHPFD